jgi:hypothetical protein
MRMERRFGAHLRVPKRLDPTVDCHLCGTIAHERFAAHTDDAQL